MNERNNIGNWFLGIALGGGIVGMFQPMLTEYQLEFYWGSVASALLWIIAMGLPGVESGYSTSKIFLFAVGSVLLFPILWWQFLLYVLGIFIVMSITHKS